MDDLSEILARHTVSVGTFHSGPLCGIHEFEGTHRSGHIHLVRKGPVRVLGAGVDSEAIMEPTLILVRSPGSHRLIAGQGAELVCADVQVGAGSTSPIIDALPGAVVVPLSEFSGTQSLLELVYDEAFSRQAGRQVALDRLCELLLIRLLRHCIDNGIARGGALSGLADVRLSKALVEVHRDPSRQWALATMAKLAGMSRARFAVRFREVIGETPASYLVTWRISLAQRLLRRGRAIKHVSAEVGYGSTAAFTRAFARKSGTSPTAWLRELRESRSEPAS